jgi:hypothetical protein
MNTQYYGLLIVADGNQTALPATSTILTRLLTVPFILVPKPAYTVSNAWEVGGTVSGNVFWVCATYWLNVRTVEMVDG